MEGLCLTTTPDLREEITVKTMEQLSLKELKGPLPTGNPRCRDRHNHKLHLNHKLTVRNVDSVENVVEMPADMVHVLNARNALHKGLKLLPLNKGNNSLSRDRNNRSARKDRPHSLRCRDQSGPNKVQPLLEAAKAEVVKEGKDQKDRDPAVAEEVNQPS